MNDPLFQSGLWEGFYNYHAGGARHGMALHLKFSNGQMSGDGSDDIGRFLILGRYDSAKLECHWIKRYVGAHNVFYRGFREGRGIWGVWEIPRLPRGGFHIWPRQSGGEESRRETEPEPEAVEWVVPQVAEKPGQVRQLGTVLLLSRSRQERCRSGGMTRPRPVSYWDDGGCEVTVGNANS